jgi:LEA14-like dessication related protein
MLCEGSKEMNSTLGFHIDKKASRPFQGLVYVSLVLLGSIFVSACGGTKSFKTGKLFAEPEYELSAIRFIEIDMESLKMEVDLKVLNPNYMKLEFKNVNYVLNLDGAKVLSGALPNPLKVPAKGSSDLTIPLTVELSNLVNGAVSLMLKREIAYDLTTTLNSVVPILEKKKFTVKKSEVLSF